jgi:hypothetical protein
MKKFLLSLFISVPMFAMQPQTQKPQLKLSNKDKIFLGVQGAVTTYELLNTTVCTAAIIAPPFSLPLSVMTGAAMIGVDVAYTMYMKHKMNNQENNK